MKTAMKVVGAMIALGLFTAGAYAEMVEVEMPAPGKTLVDFKAEYAGTKPVVAVLKHWEYQALQMAPKPTLAVAAIREERGQDFATGTKPVIGALKRLEEKK